MSFVFRQHLKSLNARMDRGEFVDFGQGKTSESEAVRRTADLEGSGEEATGRRKGFRYVY